MKTLNAYKEENTYIATLALIAAFIFAVILFTVPINAQGIDKIQRRCPPPNGTVAASILVEGDGDILHTPCPSRASIFTGNVDFTGATVTGVIGGSGTANFVPRFTASQTIGNTPFSWDATTYNFNNTALNAEFTMALVPSAAAGTFSVGDFTTTATTRFLLTQAGPTFATLAAGNASENSLTMTASSLSMFNTTAMTLGTSANSLRLNVSADQLRTTLAGWDLSEAGGAGFGVVAFNLTRTITAAGTTGAQTINKPNGTVNFAAAATAVTVTNSTVNVDSTILAIAQANDATCSVKNVVPGAGSFVINMDAACTAETRVAFWVTN